MKSNLFLAAALLISAPGSRAADWPTYLNDHRRSGKSPETINTPLTLKWKFVARQAPDTAWESPIPREVEGYTEVDRVDYDKAYQVVVSGRNVYFGSSSEDQVYCLDRDTGKVRWTFFTEGPVRLAPSVSSGRLYFGADDGWIYCLGAGDGELIWKALVGPDARKLLGNGRMISRWPVRTDVMVADGVAYCGAGVFPHEGVYVAAFDAESGALLWRNSETGEENANRGRLSPQGYQLLSDDLLYVPSGRDLPAAFYRGDGRKKFQSNSSWRASGIVGGTYATLVDDQIITGANQNVAFDAQTGRAGFGWFEGRRMVVDGGTSYMADDESILAIDRAKYAEGTRILVEMRQRHDGREKDDPQYLHAVTKAELRNEMARDKEKRDEGKITELQSMVAGYEAQLESMIAEETAFEKEFKSESTHWSTPVTAHDALIGSRNMLFAGGENIVAGVDTGTGAKTWRAEVEGRAAGLALSEGNLLVSTDAGSIYCFGTAAPDAKEPAEPAGPLFPENEHSAALLEAADAILGKTKTRKGYCLVLGLETGQLAYELARRTEMKIVAVEPDAAKVQAAREALARAGYYGKRVSVIQAGFDRLPLSNYFANIVVSEPGILGRPIPGRPEDVARMVRPLGGTVILLQAFDGLKVIEYLAAMNLGPVAMAEFGAPWGSVVRGALPGAGSWTHQYASAANTSSNDETRLRAPLGVLWYGDPGPTQMINRHAQGSPPVAMDGRMFIVGDGVVLAYDAYNGTKLWEQSYAGKPRLGTRGIPGSLVASRDGVFLATDEACLRFDPETGERLGVYEVPGDVRGHRRRWLYLGYHDGVLVGSVTESSTTQYSKALFGLDARSGEHLWTYQGDNIAQLTTAMGDGKLFLVDSSISAIEREFLLQQDKSHLAELKGKAKEEAEAKVKAADLRLAVAMDVRTGAGLWSKALDLTDCSGIHRSHGELMMMYQDGLLVFAGASGNGHFWDQYIAGEFKHRRLKVVDAGDGSDVWTADADYRIRPIVVGDSIIAEPWAYDLRTGAQKMRAHPVTGELSAWQFIRPGHHCGHVAATENLMFFRSGNSAYYDLLNDSGVSHFGGMRTGCVVNMIPANGLVHIPEASAGCQCLFSIQSTVTMEPVSLDQERGWSIYTASGAALPVRRMHLNFGAPGDRRDAEGRLWLAWPRPDPGSKVEVLGLELDVEVSGAGLRVDNGRETRREITGTEQPWLFRSGYEGDANILVPMLEPGEAPGVYTVRLYFSENAEEVASGERVFDIRVQGESVASAFDIVSAAGGRDRAFIKEISGVDVFEDLEIEVQASADSRYPPAIKALELIRTGDSKERRPSKLSARAPWPEGKPVLVIEAAGDAFAGKRDREKNFGASAAMGLDGGGTEMGDESYGMIFLRFPLDKGIPGRPLAAKLRLQCEGAGSGDAGAVYEVSGDWDERAVTFENRPAPAGKLGRLGAVADDALAEARLGVNLDGKSELSLVIIPTSTDGIRFSSREGKSPPELVIAYEPE